MNISIIEEALKEINHKYGESLTTLIADGVLHRGGDKDHVWYVCHEWLYKTQPYQIINYGSWRHGDSYTIKSWNGSQEREKGFKNSFKKHTEEAKAKLEAEKEKQHEECRKRTKPKWMAAESGKLHEYLEFKEISEPYVSRIDHNGCLLIPAYKPVKGLVGMQRIFMNPKTERFDKKFTFGIEITGSFCHLKPFKDAQYCFVSEGYATASSIQEAFPDIPSICVFNAGNISPAINSIRQLAPDIKIIIAADRDHKTQVGKRFAEKACKTFGGVIYRLPNFSVENDAWTDFNDLHAFESLKKVQEQLAFDENDFLTITCLGYMDNIYYYTSTNQKQILGLSPSNHNKPNLFSLAPVEYWKKNYGQVIDDNLTVIWDDVYSELMVKCRAVGLYDPEKIRGVGVWEDKKQYVINDGESITPKLAETNFFYQKLPKHNYSTKDPMTDEESMQVLSTFAQLPYKNQRDHIFVAAWLVQAQVYSVLPWRFHLWLTGDKGSGKSTVMDRMGKILIHPVLTSDATSSGITQELRNNARPVVFDESEATQNIQPIIDLARKMSSNNGNKTLRGSSSGKGVANNTNTVFLMASIQVAKLNGADRSRFFVVNMERNEKQSAETYADVIHNFEELEKNKERFFARVFSSIDSIKRSTDIAKAVFMDRKTEARFADQMAVCLACYWVYASTEPLTREIAEDLIESLDLMESDYMEQNKETDQDDCLHTLLQLILPKETKTIHRIIEFMHQYPADHDVWETVLGAYGMKYNVKDQSLFIGVNANNLNKEMKDRGFPAFIDLLKRDKRRLLKLSDQQRVAGYGNRKGIRISLRDAQL